MLFRAQKEEMEIKSRGVDFLLLKILTAVCFSALAGRLWFLQIRHGDDLRKYSNINRFKPQALPAPRGFLRDREGRILAGNSKTARLKINLNDTKNPEDVLKKIAGLINWSEDKIRDRVDRNQKRYGRFHPVTIKNHLSLREIHDLKLLHWTHPEVYVEEGGTRVYPLGENGAQIFGYVGETSQDDLQRLKDVKKGEIIGKSGLEKAYNRLLQGKDGVAVIEVDAHNRISPESFFPFRFLNRKAERGKSLSLTIDRDLQISAFSALNRKDAIGRRSGAVIAMKTNGEILAWVSSPGFDGNVFSSELSPEFWREFSKKKKKSFINKGLQEHYPPGSTFKPFVALAGLQEGIITEDTLIHAPAVFYLGNTKFHDHSKFGYGKINVETALEKSSNTFFYKLGLELGVDRISKYASLFHFGKGTGMELPGEIKGLVPTARWKRRVTGRPWQKGETLSLAIGQGALLATLLQMTVAYNVIATEGLVVRPFLVREIDGRPEGQPEVRDTLTDRISRRHFKTVKRGLKRVVQGRGGTARWWNLKEIPFSGKTGTVQVVSLSPGKIFKSCKTLPLDQRHHGMFIAFAPSDSPEIVVSVLTEHSCHGSTGAVPVARDIIRAYNAKYRGAEK